MNSDANPNDHRPKIMISDSPPGVSDRVSRLIADALSENPSLVIGLATGGSPVGTYRRLVNLHRTQGLDFSQATTFNLDEYVGLAEDHPQSFRWYMQQNLFEHIEIDPVRTNFLDSMASDIAETASQYEQAITDAGGIDLQLLGIGSNGHIAFNEPSSPVDCRTREVRLSDQTIQSNSRFFDSIDDVPKSAITMGIGTILEARKIVLLATGENKAKAVAAAVNGTISSDCPASLLRTHGDVIFVIDRAAASLL